MKEFEQFVDVRNSSVSPLSGKKRLVDSGLKQQYVVT